MSPHCPTSPRLVWLYYSIGERSHEEASGVVPPAYGVSVGVLPLLCGADPAGRRYPAQVHLFIPIPCPQTVAYCTAKNLSGQNHIDLPFLLKTLTCLLSPDHYLGPDIE